MWGSKWVGNIYPVTATDPDPASDMLGATISMLHLGFSSTVICWRSSSGWTCSRDLQIGRQDKSSWAHFYINVLLSTSGLSNAIGQKQNSGWAWTGTWIQTAEWTTVSNSSLACLSPVWTAPPGYLSSRVLARDPSISKACAPSLSYGCSWWGCVATSWQGRPLGPSSPTLPTVTHSSSPRSPAKCFPALLPKTPLIEILQMESGAICTQALPSTDLWTHKAAGHRNIQSYLVTDSDHWSTLAVSTLTGSSCSTAPSPALPHWHPLPADGSKTFVGEGIPLTFHPAPRSEYAACKIMYHVYTSGTTKNPDIILFPRGRSYLTVDTPIIINPIKVTFDYLAGNIN